MISWGYEWDITVILPILVRVWSGLELRVSILANGEPVGATNWVSQNAKDKFVLLAIENLCWKVLQPPLPALFSEVHVVHIL